MTIWFWIWLIVAVFTFFIETLTDDLISIWFAIGAVVALILSTFAIDYLIQIITFLSVSLVLLFSTRPLVKKWLRTNEIKTNIDSLTGKVGSCIKEIKKDFSGEVKIDGQIWTAISHDLISASDKVEILAVEGNKLIVKKIVEE